MMIFLSCSNDDNDISSEIVGPWLCTSGTTTVYDLSTEEVKKYPDSTLYPEGSKFYFSNDGTCYYLYRGIKIDCTYKIRGDKLDIIDENNIMTNDLEISSGKMILSRDNTDTELMRRIVRISNFEKQ